MKRWMIMLIGIVAVAFVIGIVGTAYAYHMDPFYGGSMRGYMNGPMCSGCRGYGNGQYYNDYSPQNTSSPMSGQYCGPYGCQIQNATPPQSGWCCGGSLCRRSP